LFIYVRRLIFYMDIAIIGVCLTSLVSVLKYMDYEGFLALRIAESVFIGYIVIQ